MNVHTVDVKESLKTPSPFQNEIHTIPQQAHTVFARVLLS